MSTPLLTEELLGRIARLRLKARTPRSGRATGAYRTRSKGVSMDLAGYRPYAPGDDLRWLDWSVYARLEKLYMKTFFDEQDSPVWLVLDASASMGAVSEAKWLLARQLAAALGAVALAGQNPLTLVVAQGENITRHRLGRGIRHLPRLLEWLEETTPQGVTQLESALRGPLLRQPPSLVMLISDGFDPEGMEEALQSMSMKGHEATFLHILDEGELIPPLEGDVLVQDAETGQQLSVTMDHESRARYADLLRQRLDHQRTAALARGVGYARAVAPADPGPLLVQLLTGHMGAATPRSTQGS